MQRHNLLSYMLVYVVSVSLERRERGRRGEGENGAHARFNSIYGLLGDTKGTGSDGYQRKVDVFSKGSTTGGVMERPAGSVLTHCRTRRGMWQWRVADGACVCRVEWFSPLVSPGQAVSSTSDWSPPRLPHAPPLLFLFLFFLLAQNCGTARPVSLPVAR